jgi:hypothetical protein
MTKKFDSKETVTFGELLMSNIYTQKELINLSQNKVITDKKELLKEIKRLGREQSKANNR